MEEIIVQATDANLSTVTSFVEEKLDEMGCSMKSSMQISVALEEMYVNVAHYAYEGKTGMVKLNLEETEFEGARAVKISLTDSGVPFDPLIRPDPDITLPAEQRKIGGLGIYMVKKSMDKVEYRWKDDQNIFSMTKRI